MQPSRRQVAFTLGVLLAINTMNFFDRQIFPAVQEKVRVQWTLSDTELGWLGTAFILIYAVIGLPLGHLADVWNRKWILALGIAVWSAMTLGSAWAWGFWSLFFLRMGVGVGEASCAPAASSLIGDLVPAERRARAMGVFMFGLPLGQALSFIVSAWVAQHWGWQMAFIVAGIPGLVLAIVVLFTFEPRSVRARSQAPHLRSQIRGPQSAIQVVLRSTTMWWIILSGAIHNFNMYGLGMFLASYLRRYHQVSLETAGLVSGLVYGFGALSIYAAGWLGDRAFRRHAAGRLNVAWLALIPATPLLLLALNAQPGRLWLCALWLLPACMSLYAYYGVVYAAIQDLIEPRLRGMAMAIYFCAMYLLGAVWGPIVTGAASDFFARRAAGLATLTEAHKAQGLHDAMFLMPLLNILLVLVLLAASRTVAGDLQRLRERQSHTV